MESQEILLETGTNEVEILEFTLGGQSFGINVAKIKQILKYEPESMTPLPNGTESMPGLYPHHDVQIPMIDLCKLLQREPEIIENRPSIVLVCELNNQHHCFLVDSVRKIHRLSWEEIQQVPATLQQLRARLTGIVTQENNQILMLDFEQIVLEISQREEEILSGQKKGVIRNKDIFLYLVEDSPTIRKLMVNYLQNEQIHRIEAFENGADAWEALCKLTATSGSDGERKDLPDLIITDVEMFGMDGLTLCKKIKEKYPKIPVVIYSSLINDQMKEKCAMVNADHCVSKQNPEELLEWIDQIT